MKDAGRRATTSTSPAGARAPVAVLVLGILAALALASLAGAEHAAAAKLRGEVVSGRVKLGSTPVTLYRAGSADSEPVRLGRSRTRGNSSFKLSYRPPHRSGAVLYLIAGRGAAVRLASVLGTRRFPRKVVVNEHTTVATGYALAQFLRGAKTLAGRSPGLQNAAAMAANLVNVRTGHLGRVLRHPPNGEQTSTLQTFNSLSNMLPRCARSARRCSQLFKLAEPPGGSAPSGTLEAIADIARNPAHHVKQLFKFSGSPPTPYRPALDQAERPDGWTLALRFDGDGMSIDGPGNFAIDAEGNLWVVNNYNFGADPQVPQCASDELFKFTPDGRFAPGSPFTGGGLSGAGFGVTIAPNGNVWVGNYGFQGVGCTVSPPRNSVSEFTPEGEPLSPPATDSVGGGYTAGAIDQPQGTIADRAGNIWIANCGNGTVTQYPDGDPSRAIVAAGLGIGSPFGIAINDRGQAFVSGNQNSRVAILNADGTPTVNSPISTAIRRPMGLATDSRGNIWVANSGEVLFPCEPPLPPFEGEGSVTLLSSDGVPHPGAPFTGGGTILPWGIAVDGDDNVWVANFAQQTLGNLCGTRPGHCPPATDTGDPIAPDSGYGFDGLVRNTGVAVDPSGNVWLTNNWLEMPFQTNPGGHQIVAYIGLAEPVKTPIIGPPRR
jgi:sugar lactone lactonase YvrE